MTRRLALLSCLLLAACNRDREVRVILGPVEGSLTVGFRCVDDTGTLLFARAVAQRHFALVFDTMTIDGGSPGCRSEELARTCVGTGRCRGVDQRYCVDIDLDEIDFDLSDPIASQKALGDYLRARSPTILADAPDKLVIVRAVATTTYCADIPAGPIRNVDSVIGCAYSCPTLLDQADSTLSLSLDALTDECETAAKACARFPDLPIP